MSYRHIGDLWNLGLVEMAAAAARETISYVGFLFGPSLNVSQGYLGLSARWYQPSLGRKRRDKRRLPERMVLTSEEPIDFA